MSTINNIDQVRAVARKVIGSDHAVQDDTTILRAIGSGIDPAIVTLDGRPLAVRVLTLIAPTVPCEPAPKRIDYAPRAPGLIAELRSDRIERARCDADRILSDRAHTSRQRRRGASAALARWPLEGAGRVEDTINLLGHAARKGVACAATLLGWKTDRVAREARIPLLLESSVKKGLDRVWGGKATMNDAIEQLVKQPASLEAWLEKRPTEAVGQPPLHERIETLRQFRAQDLEPDPSGGGRTQIQEGTAEDVESPSRTRTCGMVERARAPR